MSDSPLRHAADDAPGHPQPAQAARALGGQCGGAAPSASPRPPCACSWSASKRTGCLARDDVGGADGGAGAAARRTVYTLTAAAEALYPKRYGDLTTELLGYLGGPDGEQVDELFERRRRRRVDGARPRLANLSFDEQVAALAAILDEDGYLADADEAGGRELAHHRAQLRHPHRGTRLLPGLLERALVHPRCPARAPRWSGWRISWTAPTSAPTASRPSKTWTQRWVATGVLTA